MSNDEAAAMFPIFVSWRFFVRGGKLRGILKMRGVPLLKKGNI
jgi:hypothetical protein